MLWHMNGRTAGGSLFQDVGMEEKQIARGGCGLQVSRQGSRSE